LHDPNSNYKIITDVLGKANDKQMPYKLIIKFKTQTFSMDNKW